MKERQREKKYKDRTQTDMAQSCVFYLKTRPCDAFHFCFTFLNVTYWILDLDLDLYIAGTILAIFVMELGKRNANKNHT